MERPRSRSFFPSRPLSPRPQKSRRVQERRALSSVELKALFKNFSITLPDGISFRRSKRFGFWSIGFLVRFHSKGGHLQSSRNGNWAIAVTECNHTWARERERERESACARRGRGRKGETPSVAESNRSLPYPLIPEDPASL